MNLVPVDTWSYHVSPGTEYHISPALKSCEVVQRTPHFSCPATLTSMCPTPAVVLVDCCCSIQLLLLHVTPWCCPPWRNIPGASRGRREAFLVGGKGPSLCWGAEAALVSPAEVKLCGLSVTLCASVHHDCPDKQGRRLIKFSWVTCHLISPLGSTTCECRASSWLLFISALARAAGEVV